jgi:hypothetical protein
MLSGCAAMKAAPSQGAGFVPMEQMAPRQDLPFQKVWFKEDVDFKRYKSIYIPAVHTDHLLQSNWWQQNFRQGQMQEDLATMAQYMQQEFKTAFRNDPYHRFQVVEVPQKGSLTLELALTELVPSNVALSVLEYAPYGGGTAVRVMERATGAESTVAFEATGAGDANFGYGAADLRFLNLGSGAIEKRGILPFDTVRGTPGLDMVADYDDLSTDYVVASYPAVFGVYDTDINTPYGNSGPRIDGYEIRSAAVSMKIPCITTVQGASAAVQGIEAAIRVDIGVRSLQELHASFGRG